MILGRSWRLGLPEHAQGLLLGDICGFLVILGGLGIPVGSSFGGLGPPQSHTRSQGQLTPFLQHYLSRFWVRFWNAWDNKKNVSRIRGRTPQFLVKSWICEVWEVTFGIKMRAQRPTILKGWGAKWRYCGGVYFLCVF